MIFLKFDVLLLDLGKSLFELLLVLLQFGLGLLDLKGWFEERLRGVGAMGTSLEEG
jgi:hypothetical protein